MKEHLTRKNILLITFGIGIGILITLFYNNQDKIIEWLFDSNNLLALSTVLMAFATVTMACYTRKSIIESKKSSNESIEEMRNSIKEMELTRKETNRANILLYIEKKGSRLFWIIENFGLTEQEMLL